MTEPLMHLEQVSGACSGKVITNCSPPLVPLLFSAPPTSGSDPAEHPQRVLPDI